MGKLLKSWSDIPYVFGGAAVSGEGGGYGFGKAHHSTSDLVEHCFDRGVRIFDSAPIYGFGESEKKLGRALKNIREKVHLISKSGVFWHDNKRVDMSNDPKRTKEMFEDSLRRFNSDYIDLYMIHWPDPNVDIRFSVEVLAKLQVEGKIKHIGLCNTNQQDLKAANEVANIEVIQSEFNIFNNAEKDWQHDCSFMSWGTFDKGILTERVNKKREQAKEYDLHDCRRFAPWWKQKDVFEKIDKMKKIKDLWNEINVSPEQGALSFNLSHDFCDMALIGAKSIDDWDNIFDLDLKIFNHDLLKSIYELS